jgi:hypothetical protein
MDDQLQPNETGGTRIRTVSPDIELHVGSCLVGEIVR